MNRSVSDMPSYGSYLGVSPQGTIQSDNRKRVDRPDSETWLCEYFGAHFKVTRLYPPPDVSRVIKIDPRSQLIIKQKFEEHTQALKYSAMHESGHAVLCYALRFRPVIQIDIELGVLLGGNLSAQIQAGVADDVRFIGGTTSIEWLAEDSSGLDTQAAIGSACQGLGGFAACPESEKTAAMDRSRAMQVCSALARLVPGSTDEQHKAALSLNERVRVLAGEILANPIVADRLSQLSKRLLEKRFLNREAVEAILVPQTLPDYSDRIREIQREFNLPERSGLR
jgi:hypothetical protein